MNIDILINQQGPFPFVLDTAAEDTFLHQDLLPQLGLTSEGSRRIGGVAEMEERAAFKNVSLDISGLSFKPENVYAATSPGIPGGLKGIIGTELLQSYLMTYNKSEGYVRLEASSLPATTKTMPLNQIGKRLFSLEVMVNGVRAEGILDTGSAFSIMNMNLAQAIGIARKNSHSATVSGLNNQRVGVQVAQGISFGISSDIFRNRTMGYGALPVFDRLGLADKPVIIIGADILNSNSWSIDFPNRLMVWGS